MIQAHSHCFTAVVPSPNTNKINYRPARTRLNAENGLKGSPDQRGRINIHSLTSALHSTLSYPHCRTCSLDSIFFKFQIIYIRSQSAITVLYCASNSTLCQCQHSKSKRFIFLLLQHVNVIIIICSDHIYTLFRNLYFQLFI